MGKMMLGTYMKVSRNLAQIAHHGPCGSVGIMVPWRKKKETAGGRDERTRDEEEERREGSGRKNKESDYGMRGRNGILLSFISILYFSKILF